MKFLKSTNWQTILDEWRKNEQGLWDHLIKEKGFSSWDEWRSSYYNNLNVENLKWNLYEVSNKELLKFQCGAFPMWLKISEEVGSRYFRDIVKAKVFKNFEKLERIKKDFPFKKTCIAFKKGNDFFLFEGHHRCTSLCQKESKENIQIAIAQLREGGNYMYIDSSPNSGS